MLTAGRSVSPDPVLTLAWSASSSITNVGQAARISGGAASSHFRSRRSTRLFFLTTARRGCPVVSSEAAVVTFPRRKSPSSEVNEIHTAGIGSTSSWLRRRCVLAPQDVGHPGQDDHQPEPGVGRLGDDSGEVGRLAALNEAEDQSTAGELGVPWARKARDDLCGGAIDAVDISRVEIIPADSCEAQAKSGQRRNQVRCTGPRGRSPSSPGGSFSVRTTPACL